MNSQREIGIYLDALRRISQYDPQSDTCGPDAPERCKLGCIGCIARAAILGGCWSAETIVTRTEQEIADWLEGQGQPGYAAEIRAKWNA